MDKPTIKIAAALALLVGMGLMTGIACAKATKTPIEGKVSVAVVGPPERYWVDEEGITHYRGYGICDSSQS